MKKILILSLVVLSTIMLAGCGNKKENKTNGNNNGGLDVIIDDNNQKKDYDTHDTSTEAKVGFVKISDDVTDYYIASETTSNVVFTKASNVQDSIENNVIEYGDKIVVPEGMVLITMNSGSVTGIIAEPGTYVYKESDPNASLYYLENDDLSYNIKISYEKFKFRGKIEGAQAAYFVSLKELQIPSEFNNDKLNFKYYIRIDDPIVFILNFLPNSYIIGKNTFYLDDNNDEIHLLFSEINGVEKAYCNNNDCTKNDAIKGIASQIEEDYYWRISRGIKIYRISK